jgi:hypothetical protein
LRTFGLIFAALVAGLFGLLIPLLSDSLWQTRWPWYIGMVVALLALVWPRGLGPLYRGWMQFGAVAGWVNTRIILLLLFYALVLPVGLVMKLLRHDPMRRKLDPSVDSYRIDSKAAAREHMEKPY